MKELEKLIGKKVKAIFMNEEYLQFETDDGVYAFTVYGDCCSSSYFHDFYGVKNLLNNGPISAVKQVDVTPGDFNSEESDYIQCYGFEFTTYSQEYGDVTSVMSFRNRSNGYYGGWMESCEPRTDIPEIKEDVIG